MKQKQETRREAQFRERQWVKAQAEKARNRKPWGATPSDSQPLYITGQPSGTFSTNWDTSFTFEEAEPEVSPSKIKPEESIDPGYTLEGWFQDEQFKVVDIEFEQSPIEAVLAEVFDLDDEDQIVGVAIRDKDGNTLVTSWDELMEKRKRGW